MLPWHENCEMVRWTGMERKKRFTDLVPRIRWREEKRLTNPLSCDEGLSAKFLRLFELLISLLNRFISSHSLRTNLRTGLRSKPITPIGALVPILLDQQARDLRSLAGWWRSLSRTFMTRSEIPFVLVSLHVKGV